MKKTLLLICAMLSTMGGVSWAQTKLTPTQVKQYGSGPALEDGALAGLYNGITAGENKLTTGELPLTIYYDLGSSKNVGNIKLYWPRCTAKAYEIYVTNANPEESNVWGEAVATETDYTFDENTVREKTYPTNSNGRYVVFKFTEKSGWADSWGLMLNEIEVYQYEAATLTEITSNVSFLEVGVKTAVELTLKDQFGAAFTDEVSYTVTNGSYDEENNKITATAGGPVVVTATAGENSVSVTMYAVAEGAPTPKSGSENLEVYTASATPTWQADGGSVLGEEIEIGGVKAKIVNLKELTITPATTNPVKTYNRASIAIFPVADYTGAVVVTPDNHYTNKSFTAGEWNVIDFDIYEYSDTQTEANVDAVRLINTGEKVDVLVSNVVLYYKDPTAFDYTVTDGVAKVTGKITSGDVATINGLTAAAVDLSDANTEETSLTFTPTNPNTIYIVPATVTGDNPDYEFTPTITLTNSTNVVAKADAWYFALTPIKFTDDNNYQPWTTSINTRTVGYTITRSVASGKYVTAYFPTTVTNIAVEDGDIYTLDTEESSATTVKFNKAATVGKATPFIVHATGAATITTTGAGDFYINENGGDPESISFGGSCKFIGNLAVKAGTGVEYGLSNSTDEAPEFRKIGTNGKIGAFRAYFTGLSATTPARAIFDDGEGTTRIEKIENILRQDGVYYNLQGQRVLNPTKGLYIVNGKKVVMK